MSRKKWCVLLLLLSSLFLAHCTVEPITSISISSEPFIAQSLPDRDIVFQLATHYSGGLDERVGFINADGSGESYLGAENFQAVVEPIWTDDGSMILFIHPANFIEGITKEGYRMKFVGQGWMQKVSPIHRRDQVLIESSHEGHYAIKRIDLETGDVLEIYQLAAYPITNRDGPTEHIHLGSNNLHEGILVFSRSVLEDDFLEVELRVCNTVTNECRVLLKYDGDLFSVRRIISPAFSPDGQWIAYTSNDGIYLIRPDGSENHRIVKSDVVNPGFWPPVASWSPDGQWIVYHRCTLNDLESCRFNVEDSTIFKYNIETGEIVLLVEGGVNPYWRWRE